MTNQPVGYSTKAKLVLILRGNFSPVLFKLNLASLKPFVSAPWFSFVCIRYVRNICKYKKATLVSKYVTSLESGSGRVVANQHSALVVGKCCLEFYVAALCRPDRHVHGPE